MDFNKIKQYGLMGVIALLLVVVVWGAVGKWKTDREMARLRNEVAARDQTIEVQKGVYTKLALETEEIKKLLDAKDAEVKGEIVLLVGPATETKASEADLDTALRQALEKMSIRDAAVAVSGALGLKKSVVYQRALALAAEN